MNIKNEVSEYVIKYPKFLFFLMISYSMFVVMSNWYDTKIIDLFGISITPGSLIYSITFLQLNIITENYGFKNARLAIFFALLFNLLFILYGFLITNLPSKSSLQINSLFDEFLFANFRIIIASFVGFIIAEPINSYFASKLKIHFKGKYLGIRFILSTLFSGVIDSVLFMMIAFYGVLEKSALLQLTINVWFIKSIVEIIFLPLAIRISKKLKEIEKLDIYDNDTVFKIFSLDTTYTEKNNRYNFKNGVLT